MDTSRVRDHPYAVRYRHAIRRFFRLRTRTAEPPEVATMVALSLGFAGLTGLAAQVRLYLPFSPVPVTGQTFPVLLSGVVLGARYGGLSQFLYLAIGAAGLTWFADASGGVGVLLGASGGYIVGFVAAAAVAGYLTDRYADARRVPVLAGALLAVNFVVIYAFGLAGLELWYWRAQGFLLGPVDLVVKGLAPFVPGDVFKVLLAAGVGGAVTPSGSLDREVD